MVRKITVLAAETRSFKRCVIALREADVKTSAKTVERVVHDVGRELAERRDAAPSRNEALAQRPQEPPELAVVECDGGRIRCRQPGHGPGVHLESTGWRENKNACLIRAARQTFAEDPQPDPPDSFSDPQHVAKIVETEALSVAALDPQTLADQEERREDSLVEPPDWRPKCLVRTVISSMASAAAFGKQMASEAKRRRFAEAAAKAFLGDGLPWNWSIWKKHFRSFTPILDFIHPLSYLFLAAKAVHEQSQNRGISIALGCEAVGRARWTKCCKSSAAGEPDWASRARRHRTTIRVKLLSEPSATWKTIARGWTIRSIAGKVCR